MSKISKKRNCPAAGREIQSTECGAGRGSRYACPPECAFNPLSPTNYDQFLEIEGALDRKCMEWLAGEPGGKRISDEVGRLVRLDGILDANCFFIRKFFSEKDANGLSSMQRWEKAGFPGLDNDERVLLRAKSEMKIVLMEVHRVLDGLRVEGVDLLTENREPLTLCDRAFSSRAPRFANALAWCYRIPGMARLVGAAYFVNDSNGLEPLEILLETVRHLGGPTDLPGVSQWVGTNSRILFEAMEATRVESHRRMLQGMSGEFGKVLYELKAPYGACADLLDKVLDVELDDLSDGEMREGFAEARVWFEPPNAGPAIAPGRKEGTVVLGRVLLGQNHWRLEAMGAERIRALKAGFEKQMGKAVLFKGERIDNMAEAMLAKQPVPNLELVPPRLVETPSKLHLSSSRIDVPPTALGKQEALKAALDSMDRQFLDEPVPLLEGKTPRKAATDPRLRKILIGMMKSRVRQCDEQNLMEGGNRDVNWMLRELGLAEILFPPPPVGRRPKQGGPEPMDYDVAEDFAEYVDDLDEPVEMDPALPPAPRLPDRPFNDEQIESRVRAFTKASSLTDIMKQYEEDGCTLFEDLADLAMDFLSDEKIGIVTFVLLPVWAVFVPVGTRGKNASFLRLEALIMKKREDMLNYIESSSERLAELMSGSSRQPHLAGFALTGYLNMVRESAATTAEEQMMGCAIILAAIDAMDEANRS